MDNSLTADELHRPIPIFGGQQPVEQVREAYWRFDSLIQSWWYIRAFAYRSEDQLAYMYAITPRQRALTILCPSRDEVPELAWEFISTVRDIGLRSDRDEQNYLADLRHAIYSHPRFPLPAVQYQTRAIPSLDAAAQPAVPVRVAYWMAAMLIDVYGWDVHSIGTPIASGGFIASIPEDTTAIYPKDSDLDGTIAPALARILGRLSPAELDQLRHLLDVDVPADTRSSQAESR